MTVRGIRSLVCAVALLALALPFTDARGAAQDPSPLKLGREYAPAPHDDGAEPPALAEVDGAIRRVASQGRIRHLRLDKRTGRAAALFGELEPAPAARRPEVEHAAAFVSEHAALVGVADVASELEVERSVDAPAGTHVVFRQKLGGRPVFDARAAVHIGADGRVYGLTSSFAPGLDAALAAAEPSIDEETARAVALERLGITEAALGEGPATAELGVAAVGSGRLAWRLVVPVAEPLGQWELFVDAGDGSVIGEPRSLVLGAGRARVFVPNPIVSTGQTTLRDDNNSNAAVPGSAYVAVDLLDLDSSGFVTGPYVTTDRTDNRVRASGGDFTGVRREDPGFNELEVYWAIDSAQRYIQSLGVRNAANYRIRVDAYAFPDDNSNYTASGDGTGVLNFGWGGVDDAQDAEIVWHEYGHAVLDNQARLAFGGESGAIHEGWGDYFAATMSTTVPGDPRFHPYVGEWDAVSYSSASVPHLRRVDTGKRYPEDLRFQVHSDGEIWSSCLWRLNKTLGRQTADRIILNAHFLFPRTVTFEDAAAAVLESDRQLNGGANAAGIVAAFAAHGIELGGGAPSVTGVRVKKGKLLVDGALFETNAAVIEVDGEALGATKYPKKFRRRGVSSRVTSKDARVRQLAAGVTVQVTVFNPRSGLRSAPFEFTP